MRKLVIRLMILPAILGAATPAFAQALVVVERDAAIAPLRNAMRLLSAAQVRARSPQVAQLLAQVRAQLRAARLVLQSAQPVGAIGMPVPVPAPMVMPMPMPTHPIGALAEPPLPAPPPPPAPVGPQPMEESSFAGLLKALSAESFDRQKLDLLRSAASSQHFVIAQLLRLLALFSFENDKLNVVELLAPRVLDKQDAFKLSEAFSFSNSKSKALELMR